MNFRFSLLCCSGLALAFPLSAQVVYEDNFDNDTLGTNTGTGGGMTTIPLFSPTENEFEDNGNLTIGGGNAARRGVATTVNAFDVSSGFTLEFLATEPNPGNAGYVDVCLTQVRLAEFLGTFSPAEGTFTTGFADSGEWVSSTYGLGVAMGEWYADGPRFNNGLGGGTAVFVVGGTPGEIPDGVLVSLTVKPDDSWSYSVDGSVVASGADFVAGAGVIDLSQPMYVNAYGQPNATFGSIKLTALGSGMDFATWIATPGFGIPGGEQGFLDDPDQDKLVNGMEGFLGTDPSVPNPGLVQVGQSGTEFTFQHPQADPGLSDVTGSYEWSTDLQIWNPPGTAGSTTVTITPSVDDPVAGTTTVTADVAGSTVVPGELYVRAVATQS